MQNAGAAWLMTTLVASPALVSLMQTATSLPTFLFGLPAGALADIVDRRRLMLATQAWMLASALALAVLTVLGEVGPWTLLALTFSIGAGVALSGPAWQATSPHLVPPAELPSAVALNGVAVNLGRAAGPAAGGLLLSAAGASAVFFANAASFVGMLGVVFRWTPPTRRWTLPPERVASAVLAGVRYLRHSPPLRAVLVRTVLFVGGASALFALLPVVASRELDVGSAGFGLLLGVLGLGAIAGAALLPRLRRLLSLDALVVSGTLVVGGALLVLALLHDLAAAFVALLAAGLSWIALLSSLNVVAQTSTPAWVRARALAAYLLVFQGGQAIGSIVWGGVAELASLRSALLASVVFLLLGAAAARRWRLRPGLEPEVTPFSWPEPSVHDEAGPSLDEGPILVTVEYRIARGDVEEFLRLVREVGRVRRRDGAYRWGIYRDLADPERYLETFLLESWVEHLRQHHRGTVADRRLTERLRELHRGEEPPAVSHLAGEAWLGGVVDVGRLRGSARG